MEKKDFSIKDIENKYDEVANYFRKLLRLDDFSLFEQNLILLYEIDYNSKKGLDKLRELCHSAILIYFYSDIELVILKNYLKEKYHAEFDDDDTLKYVLTSSAKLSDQFSLEIKHINDDDATRIFYNLEIILELNDRDVFYDILNENEINNWLNLNNVTLYRAINNLQLRLKLIDMGLEEYVINEVNEYLSEDSIYEDLDIDVDFDYGRSYS